MGRTAGATRVSQLYDALPLDKSRYLDPACLLFRCALVGAPRANRLLLLMVSSRFFATSSDSGLFVFFVTYCMFGSRAVLAPSQAKVADSARAPDSSNQRPYIGDQQHGGKCDDW